MRPKSIEQYEMIYIASIVIGFAALFFLWPTMAGQLTTTPLDPGTMRTVLIGSTLFGVGINLLLLWLTARKGSEVARIIVGLFFAIGIVSGVWALVRGTAPGMAGVLRVVQIILQAIMIYLLFVPADAKAWFARRRHG